MPTADLEIHEIQTLSLREVFAREDTMFTPWLADAPNLRRLGHAIGMTLELVEVEARLANFRTDILAENVTDRSRVVIENQFNRSDHDHLGKTLTYLAGHDARTVVWLAESFSDDHLAALNWLNENTPADVYFFAVVPRVLRIANSPPGLQFEVVLRPNHFVKRVRASDRQLSESTATAREQLWKIFFELAAADPVLRGTPSRYGGRLGYAWLLPEVDLHPEHEPHLLVYLSTTGASARLGIHLEGRKDAPDGVVDGCAKAWALFEPVVQETLPRASLDANGFTIEVALENDEGLRQGVETVLPLARLAVEAITRAFKR